MIYFALVFASLGIMVSAVGTIYTGIRAVIHEVRGLW